MSAARTFDPSKGSFSNFAGSQIFGAVTGDARSMTKPEQSAGADGFWYNQLRTSIGENTVPTQFYTPGGAPLVDANGMLNTSASTRQLPDYEPVSLARAEMDRYISAKEGGLIGGEPDVLRIERGMRRLNSNLAAGNYGSGDNSFIGANSQEADAISGSTPSDVLGNPVLRILHRSTKVIFSALSGDKTSTVIEAISNRSIFKTSSMAQQVELEERNTAMTNAQAQIAEQAQRVPQVAYQVGEMKERLISGRVAPGYASRFREENPGLIPLSKTQYSAAAERVRSFERPEGIIPAQPLRNSDVGDTPTPPASGGGNGASVPPNEPPQGPPPEDSDVVGRHARA